MNRPFLKIAVFVCGGELMIMELVGSRVLAPYLGTSLFVWTSLIGVILSCLSLGYWAGGVLADKKPELKILSWIIFLAGVFIALSALSCDWLLFLIQELGWDIRLSAVMATFILFGIPSVFLGMVCPFAVRLKIAAVDSSGSISGTLYALSTLGSIAGTFLTGFFLLSVLSHRTILFCVSSSLILLSMLLGLSKTKSLAALLLVLIASSSEPFVYSVMGNDLIDENTSYNRVWIYNAYMNNRPARVMQVNDAGDSAMFIPDNLLAFEYTNYFRLAGHFNNNIERALMIGGGGYSYPKFFLKNHPQARMDVVEIDPKLTALSYRYFGLKNDSRLQIFHEDARTFLNKTKNQYDVVFGDVYKSRAIPFQLISREALTKIYQILNKNGIFVINVISAADGDKGRMLRALLTTLNGIFPDCLLFPVQNPGQSDKVQNWVILAFKNKEERVLVSENPELNAYLSHVWTRPIPMDVPILTDQFAPVENYTAGWITSSSDRKNGILQKKIQSQYSN